MSLDKDVDGALGAYQEEMEQITVKLTEFWMNMVHEKSMDGKMPAQAIPLLVSTAVMTAGITTVKLALAISSVTTECALHNLGLHDQEDLVNAAAIAALESLQDNATRRIMEAGLERHGFEKPNDN